LYTSVAVDGLSKHRVTV